MNSSVEPKMPVSFQNLPTATAAASSQQAEAERDHACSGQGRCCGGCRNPKRPLANQAEQNGTGSTLQMDNTLQISSALPSKG
jgi:hypothetical protein